MPHRRPAADSLASILPETNEGISVVLRGTPRPLPVINTMQACAIVRPQPRQPQVVETARGEDERTGGRRLDEGGIAAERGRLGAVAGMQLTVVDRRRGAQERRGTEGRGPRRDASFSLRLFPAMDGVKM